MNIDLNDWDLTNPHKPLQEIIKDGMYDLRIIDVEYGLKRYKYVKFKFKVIGYERTTFFVITFNPHRQDYVNKIIYQMADAFNVPEEEIDISDFESWIGRTGRGYVENCEFKHNSAYRVKYFEGHVEYDDNSNLEEDLKFQISELASEAISCLIWYEDENGNYSHYLSHAESNLREIKDLIGY